MPLSGFTSNNLSVDLAAVTDPDLIARYADVFAGALNFRNSDAEIMRYPFPFGGDRYDLKIGVEPHDRTGETGAFHAFFDIDEHYLAAIADRAATLKRDPSRFNALPHMIEAQWEAMDYIMSNVAYDFPKDFSYIRDGNTIYWQNRLLGIDHVLKYGDREGLPCDPLEYITRQVQGDFALLDQRDGSLWLDAGMITEAGGWSFDFIFGMDWRGIHGPVKAEAENRVIERALKMTMSLAAHAPQRRVNWLLTIKPRLDISLENRPYTLGDSLGNQPGNLPDDLFMRTEFQQLYRLPKSNAIIFVLRNYLASFRELARCRKWAIRMHRVLRDLDPTLERFAYTTNRSEIVEWLSQFDDGRELSPGRGPDQDALDPEWR
ncbi:DUF3445 domain-containing protein [Agrobacterium sp. T29]|uniref:heme-dependent oxidative N-demethylase family protein n=1 Tax=Agrobacterium sp. T29 TaxID=2580515 RepID=UPI00115D6DF3|nr:DUF3445 domain-containing protein [Agrobacterium sp. T29]